MTHASPAWRRLFSRARFRHLRRELPLNIANRGQWLFREWLKPVLVMPVTVKAPNGASYYLSSDPLDGVILTELLQAYDPLFYPPEMAQLPEGAWGLDVGAHHGAYAVTTLTRFPKLHLISVEPDPAGFKVLAKNIALNRLEEKCELVEAAITDAAGEFLLEQSSEGSWGNSLVPFSHEARTAKVRGVTLATILRGRKIEFLKSNCEGGEYSLIPQMLQLDHLPKVVVLLLHPRNGEENRLLQSLAHAGYEVRPTCTSEDHPRYVCVRH